jgi:ZIP family zinc transporter/zinc and cadmium transporter
MGVIILFAVVAGCAELLGGLLIVSKRQWPALLQETFLALGAGFILALVFLELIPASIGVLGEEASLWIIIGFATIHFFEHTVVGHLHFGEETHSHMMVSKVAGLSTFSGLLIHAFFDGFSIAIGAQFDFLIGLLIFIAILLHKFPEGLTIGSVMISAGFSRKGALLAAGAVAVATVLGAAGGLALGSVEERVLGMAFAFTAGAGAYVGASDLIPEINKSERRTPPFFVFGGMMLFYVAEQILEGFVG